MQVAGRNPGSVEAFSVSLVQVQALAPDDIVILQRMQDFNYRKTSRPHLINTRKCEGNDTRKHRSGDWCAYLVGSSIIATR